MFSTNVLYKGVRFDKDDAGGSGDTDDAAKKAANQDSKGDDAQAEFNNWLDTQPDEVKTSIAKHTKNLLSALQKERKNAGTAKELEKELGALREAEEKRKKDAMTKEEQLASDLATWTSRATSAEGELRKLRLETAVEREAVRLNFADPGDAFRLIDLGELKIADDGAVTGAKELLVTLAKDKPYLLKQDKEGDNIGNATRRGQRNAGSEKKPAFPKAKVSF